MVLPGGRVAKAVAVAIVLVLVAGGAAGAAIATGAVELQQPTVAGIENEWGAVTAETTEIRTRVTVSNPNPVGVPPLVSIEYDVSMNDVTVATGGTGAVGLPAGETTIELVTEIDNGKIPRWWATHINNGERTTLSIRPAIDVPLLGARELPERQQSFRTDLLGALAGDTNRSLSLGGEPLLVVTRTEASWGTATANRTPLNLAVTMHNPSGSPISFDELGYRVTMNDVVLANGTAGEPLTVAPGATETMDLRFVLDTGALDEWWVSHIRGGEESRLAVDLFAVVERGGGTRWIPLEFLGPTIEFRTDILGGGTTEVERLDRGDVDFEPPTVASIDTSWTAVGEETTRVTASAVIENPNGANATLTELLRLDVGYVVTMNGVTVADAAAEDRALGANETTIRASDRVPGERIERWWMTHVNNGERTVVNVSPGVTADLGFVSLPIDVPDRRRTIETNLVESFDSSEPQTVTVQGRTLLRITGIRAEWGTATMARTPIDLAVAMEPAGDVPVTITEFGYTVTMNDVVLADNASSVDVALSEGPETLKTTLYLDTSKIGEWWVSHLENGERSDLEVSAYVVVEAGGVSTRVPLEGLGTSTTFETNIAG